MTELANNFQQAKAATLVGFKLFIVFILIVAVWLAVAFDVNSRAGAAGGKVITPSLSDFLLLKRKVQLKDAGTVTYHPFGKSD